MDVVRIIASVVVGGAFIVAGASKIVAGPAWASQADGLGAPRWSVALVPPLEIVLGALLVAQVARRPIALACAGLLIVFTGLILVRLSQGKRPPCACFGAWSAKPIGAGHVVRNVALLGAAVVAAS